MSLKTLMIVQRSLRIHGSNSSCCCCSLDVLTILAPLLVGCFSTPATVLSVQKRCYVGAKTKSKEEHTSLRHIDQHFQSIPQENRDKASFLEAIGWFFSHFID